jgi:hypothetical protein
MDFPQIVIVFTAASGRNRDEMVGVVPAKGVVLWSLRLWKQANIVLPLSICWKPALTMTKASKTHPGERINA